MHSDHAKRNLRGLEGEGDIIVPQSHATQLRTTASQTLSKLLTQHSTTYPSLSHRIMKTLLLALISPGKGNGTTVV